MHANPPWATGRRPKALRLSRIFGLVAVVCFAAVVYLRASNPSAPALLDNFTLHSAANSTLGFGKIYAVSAFNSSRLSGLLDAANVTGLDIEVPPIPDWQKEEVQKFRDPNHLNRSKILNGSIKAWMSHAIVLDAFLESGAETAMIIEDDVDWDIRLRTMQIPHAAAAQKTILPKTDSTYYWGHPDDWDLLYLGHCGDYFGTVDKMRVGVGVVHPEDLRRLPHILYKDTTLPEPTDVHPFTQSLLSAFNIPRKTRLIHKSKWPLCTFGYAVTRDLALRLLEDLAPPVEIPGKWVTAYDIAILEACRDKGLRCFTVTPELFHHMKGTSLIDGVAKTAGDKPPADRVGEAQVWYRNETSNIGCGFWSKDFQWNGDQARLAWLQEEVGRKGRCVKPGRNDDGSMKPGWRPQRKAQIPQPRRLETNWKLVHGT